MGPRRHRLVDFVLDVDALLLLPARNVRQGVHVGQEALEDLLANDGEHLHYVLEGAALRAHYKIKQVLRNPVHRRHGQDLCKDFAHLLGRQRS